MVILSLKTFSGHSYQIDFDTNDDVSKIKDVLIQQHQLPDNLKLIYKGKILQDNQKVAEINFQEGSFIIISISHKPSQSTKKTENAPQNSQPAPSSTPQSSTTSTTPTTSITSTTSTTSTTSAQPQIQTPPQSTIPNQQPQTSLNQNQLLNLPDREKFQENLESLLALGYPKDICERALIQSFNNLERAADLIINNRVSLAPPPPRPSLQPNQRTSLNQPNQPSQGQNRPIQLYFSPHIPISADEKLLRDMLLSDPNKINLVIQIISETNPELAQKIQQNAIPFLQSCGITATKQGNQYTFYRSENSSNPSNILQRFSPSERDSIQRICQMGFDPALVIQVFEACGRNEAATINVLSSMN